MAVYLNDSSIAGMLSSSKGPSSEEGLAYKGTFKFIENYIYLYHLKKFIIIPMFPESISDSMKAEFSSTKALARTAPLFSYQNSGPRTFTIALTVHRDLINEMNDPEHLQKQHLDATQQQDYLDQLVKGIQAIALPKYSSANKMVDPPMIAVRFGSELFCKGIVEGGVTVNYKPPIIGDYETGRYAVADISFTVTEIDPYDAEDILQFGSYRGPSETLDRQYWATTDSVIGGSNGARVGG